MLSQVIKPNELYCLSLCLNGLYLTHGKYVSRVPYANAGKLGQLRESFCLHFHFLNQGKLHFCIVVWKESSWVCLNYVIRFCRRHCSKYESHSARICAKMTVHCDIETRYTTVIFVPGRHAWFQQNPDVSNEFLDKLALILKWIWHYYASWQFLLLY